VIVNRFCPPFDAAATGPAAARALWRDRRAVNETELRRLREAWDGAILELPLVPAESGLPLTRELASRLDPWLAGRAA
jgi:hypothetical protein